MWILENNQLSNTEFIDIIENIIKIPCPDSLWRIENNQIFNKLLFDIAEKPVEKIYPDSLWRIENSINNNYLYNKLLLDIQALNLFQQPAKELIHVYDSRSGAADFEGNGYAIIEPISCEVRQEKNGIYESKLTVNVDKNNKFQYLTGNNILKIPLKYHGETNWQLFRIYLVSRRMDNSGNYRIVCNANHIFYDLNHRILHCKLNGNGSDSLQKIMNSVVGTGYGELNFSGFSDISAINNAEYDKISITAALLGDDSSFVNCWGGNLYRDNFYFSINRKMEKSVTTGTIIYRNNMKEIEFSLNYSDCVTYLFAEDNFGNQLKIINQNIPTVEFPHHIYKHVIFNYSYENLTRFQADAQAYFDEHKQPEVNVKVSIADLPDDDLYNDFRDLSGYEVGDKVIIYHNELNINYSNLEIISKTLDIVNHQTTEIEIGTFKNAISRENSFAGITSNNSSEAKQINALQSQIDDALLSIFVTTPITTIDGKYITTSDEKYLLYKE